MSKKDEAKEVAPAAESKGKKVEQVKFLNNGSRIHTPICEISVGENTVVAGVWESLEKLPAIKNALKSKRLELIK